MFLPRTFLLSLLLPAILVLTGCSTQRTLMPTPNFIIGGLDNPFEDVPESRQQPTVEILYATDRQQVWLEEEGTWVYTGRRRGDLGLGVAQVSIGEPGLDWETLVRQSTLRDRTLALPLEVSLVLEQAKFAMTPFPIHITDSGVAYDPDAGTVQEQGERWLKNKIRTELAETDVKKAYLFVHGYNTSFHSAIMTVAEMWHFSGRRGVPMAYSWPSKQFGLLKGYAYDRESGEYTIYHLKQFLRTLMQVDELEQVDVIAHSRGADVVATAIRELLLETRGFVPVTDPPESGRVVEGLKFGHVVLVAPDVDSQVAAQRYVAENLSEAAQDFTIYSSPTDKALEIVEFIFGSNRIGALNPTEFTEQERMAFEMLPDTSFIDVRVKTDFFGHGYFHKSPEVASDLYFLFVKDQDPGDGYRDNLEYLGPNFWRITEDYPLHGSVPAEKTALAR
jgi:esterase/lipase superfamily enzyme